MRRRPKRRRDKWNTHVKIVIPFESARALRATVSSIKLETQAFTSKRAIVKVSAAGNRLRIEIRAREVVSLRAVTNSYLRMISAIRKVLTAFNP
jgi:tRNA threonylcarbamoyladenosine modification (KEOPS) complex  Pcc1 subunit